MKPVKNERHTEWDIGTIIMSYWHQYRLHPIHYIIVGFAPCSRDRNSAPCESCTSGMVGYVVRRFNKRVGRNQWVFCGTHQSTYRPQYFRIDPITKQIIDGGTP